MELYEAIEKRRTIRVFKAPATEEQVRKILLAGTKAPSGRNTQPWEFILVEDQSLINQIAEIKYHMTLKKIYLFDRMNRINMIKALYND